MQDCVRRILCVDDNLDNCEIIRFLLTQAHFEVAIARTVVEALALARAGKFDLHLLDERLPDGSGIELGQTLRLLNRQAPILFYSADGRPATRQRALQSCAQEYLLKPDALDELVQTIERLLQTQPQTATSGNHS